MKYAFIAEHRPQYSVRRMCRCLNIHPSGFYAWIKNPLSHRAREDARQTKLLEEAWNDSGKVYGYRKLHDDLVELGETSCPNRVARMARLAGIRAEIGYKRKPGKYGGRPSVVVDNTLDRQFDVTAPDTAWVSDITYIKTYEGFLLSGGYHRPLLTTCDWLGDTIAATNRPRAASPSDGCLATQT